jgi:hypothetical protein
MTSSSVSDFALRQHLQHPRHETLLMTEVWASEKLYRTSYVSLNITLICGIFKLGMSENRQL